LVSIGKIAKKFLLDSSILVSLKIKKFTVTQFREHYKNKKDPCGKNREEINSKYLF